MSARLSAEDRRWLNESCARSGVPVKITDPTIIVRAARELHGEGHTLYENERRVEGREQHDRS